MKWVRIDIWIDEENKHTVTTKIGLEIIDGVAENMCDDKTEAIITSYKIKGVMDLLENDLAKCKKKLEEQKETKND